MRSTPWLLLAFAPSLGGCGGYHTLADTPGRIRSAAVLAFQNRTPYTGLEFELHEALVKELQAKSRIAVVRADEADGVLEGRILDFSRAVLKQGPEGQDLEFQITLTADFVLKERRTGKVLAEHQGASVSGTFLITRGETEATARARAMSKLAERIVSMLLYRW